MNVPVSIPTCIDYQIYHDERNAELRKQDFECVRRHGYLATIEPGYQRVCLSELKIMEFNEVWSRVEVK